MKTGASNGPSARNAASYWSQFALPMYEATPECIFDGTTWRNFVKFQYFLQKNLRAPVSLMRVPSSLVAIES